MMEKDEARRTIIAEWLGLPREDRATEDQAALFAMKAQSRYQWPSEADAYQETMGWLSAHIGKE